MGQFSSYAVLLSALAQHALAVPDVRATLTAVYGEAAQALQGFSAKPTGSHSDANHLFKRYVPNPTCGYVSADIYTPFTCYSNQYCGLRTDLGVVGCCSTYSSLSNGQFTLTGCAFRTTCYGSTETSLCTGTCTDDPRVAYCTNSAYPYCMIYTFTDVGISYYRCNESPGIVTDVAQTYTSPTTVSVTTTTASTAITTSSSPIAPAAQNPAGSGGVTPSTAGGAGVTSVVPVSTSAVPVSQHSTPTGAIVGGAVGGAAILIAAIAIGLWFYFKHKKSKRSGAVAAGTGGVAAATATAGGAAYSANDKQKTDPAKAPELAVASSFYDNDKMGQHPPPSYASPQMQHAQTMASPVSQQGHLSQNLSEVEGRAISPTPHSTGISELGSPSLSAQAGPTNDWNRPYHELE